jgi:NADPH:quinone reductase-like Zn-dependent oxidoreductase
LKRVVVPHAGGWEVLKIEEAPHPTPGGGEVLVTTEAVGVNFADVVVRMGLYESARKYVGWPITPGFEFAGVVTAVGPGVDGVTTGSRVLGFTRFGGYSTHVVVPHDQVFRVPKGFTMSEAAAFPVVFLTAHHALFELAGAKPGMKILVHSAAGGVGGALLQLARVAGCVAIGVVGSTGKVEVAQSLGAHAVIDKSKEDLWRIAQRHAPDGYDAVFDANGVSTLRESYAHLGAPGRLVVYGFHSMLVRGRGKPSWPKLAVDWMRTPRFDPMDMTNRNRSVMGFNLSYLFERKAAFAEVVERLVGWAEERRIEPPRVTEFPFDDVAQAHRAIESGTTTGKLVLVTGDEGRRVPSPPG